MGCEEHNVIIERMAMIIDRLDKTEAKTDKNTEDINHLQRNKASNDQKFERVFELLGELKESMGKIEKAISRKNDRLPTMMYSVAGVIAGSVISGVIMWIVTR